MLFEKLSETINQFPKLNEAYQERISQGYFITNITVRSTSPNNWYKNNSIELVMENDREERILITANEGIVNSLFINSVSSSKGKIHENIILNHETILNKEFKKKIIGGYDPDEVNHFLDIIINDYKFIENGLLQEFKTLQEDIKKLKMK